MKEEFSGILGILVFMFIIGGLWGMVGFILAFMGFGIACYMVYPLIKLVEKI